MNYSPQCTHSLDPLPAGQANLGRQYLDELLCGETGDPSIQEQCESSDWFTAERELLQFQAERKARNNHSTLSTKHFCLTLN